MLGGCVSRKMSMTFGGAVYGGKGNKRQWKSRRRYPQKEGTSVMPGRTGDAQYFSGKAQFEESSFPTLQSEETPIGQLTSLVR